MRKNLNIEAEGNELVLKNKAGDYVVIPKKHRAEVQQLMKKGCHGCIDDLVETLPLMEDYADDGTLVVTNDPPASGNNKGPVIAPPTTENPTILQPWAKPQAPTPGKASAIGNPSPKNARNLSVQEPPAMARDNSIQQIAVPIDDIKALAESEKKKKQDEKYKGNYQKREIGKKEEPFDIDKLDMTSLRKLSSEQVKELQAKLVSENYLEQEEVNVDPSDTKAVAKLQKELKRRGYDLGKFGENKDGIDGKYGKMTELALRDYNKTKEIDGVLGKKTIAAFKEYKLKNEPSVSSQYRSDIEGKTEKEIQQNLQGKGYYKAKEGDFNYDTENILLKEVENTFYVNDKKTCDNKECAYYVGEQIQNKVKSKGREKIGAYGDAWTIHANLMGSGATSIYNVFPGKKDTVSSPERYLSKLTDKKVPLEEKDLKPGDVVNMYYGGSPNVRKAYNEGSSVWSTHVGIVKQDDKGNLFVEHNVSGKIRKEPISKLLNNESVNEKNKPLRITAITRPAYGFENSAEVYEPTSTELDFKNVTNTGTSLGSKQAAEFTQVLVNNKDVLLKDIPITGTEFDNLVKATRVIGWKESNYQSNPKGKVKDFLSDAREALNIREASKGYTQLKDEENLDESLRTNLNINNETLADNKKSAVATMYALSTKYLKIKESLSKDVRLTPDELAQLALISWNEPVDMVIKTANKYKSLDKIIKAYQDSYGYNDKKETLFPYNASVVAFNNYIK